MSTFRARLLCVMASMQLLTGAAWAQAVGDWMTYQHPQSGVEYQFRTDQAQGQGRVIGFAINTTYGRLETSITYNPSAGVQGEAVSRLEGQAPITFTFSSLGGGVFDETFSFEGVGYLTFRTTTSPVSMALIATDITDCSLVGAYPTMAAVDEVAPKLAQLLNVVTTSSGHLEQIVSVLAKVDAWWKFADQCTAFTRPRPSFCQYTSNFELCEECCRMNAATGLLCGGLSIACVRFPMTMWCGGAIACVVVKDKAVELEVGACGDVACEGKPGDPSCQEPPPCDAEHGGICTGTGGFCGPGGNSMCGSCPNGGQCCVRD